MPRISTSSPPCRSVGFFVVLSLALIFLGTSAVTAQQGLLRGRALDGVTGAPIVGVVLSLTSADSLASPSTLSTYSDTAGFFRFDALEPGSWQLHAGALGYRVLVQALIVTAGEQFLELTLQPRPLVMDELVVRTRHDRAAAAFVERLDMDATQRAGVDLAQALDGATGVNVRRYGGLGSFSTVSIRGSTSEQVQVFLDGIPLNSALGGGVDLGSLPLGGVESIEVYRGAVPARFGGNSIGGVVHIRTRSLGSTARAQLHANSGSFATRQLGASLVGPWKQWQYLGLVDYSASANTFRFWDDNGTEYNANDDGWAKRLNSDFASLRTLFKVGRPLGASRLQIHGTFDLNHKGIPGLGNNQSLNTRYNTRRQLGEATLYGPLLAGRGGYRLKAYHTTTRDEYKDLRGEVGVGVQHQRNSTRAYGLRGELNSLWYDKVLLSVFAVARREHFVPRDELREQSRMLASRRRGLTLGGEVEMPLPARFQLGLGGQWEHLADRLFDEDYYAPSLVPSPRKNSENLWGLRLRLSRDLGAGWAVQGHRGRYARAPNFFELFGDRGAVIGNSKLTSETGQNWDVGLVYRSTEATGIGLAEIVYYRNSVDDLIRFVYNSQQVSRPHNIGAALLRGLETRVQVRVLSQLRLRGNYVYQRAENRSPFSFEKGNDLPNAPRHRLGARLELERERSLVYYELSRESRHFLDRANLRPVPVRTLHNIGGRLALATEMSLSVEVRNVSDNQIADLWGYPLPGRAYFLALNISHSTN